jgi:hypothetical protein
MRNTITKLMQDLDFQRLIHNAGIEPAPLFDIEVIDAEIVEPNNILRFYNWMDSINSNFLNDAHAMSRGALIVANHKINRL